MNNSDIDVGSKHLDIVITILIRNLPGGATVLIFGSRATKKAKQFSDLDLAVDAGNKLSLAIIADLKEDFENSDLPYTVDIVDLNNVEPEFKELILTQGVELSLHSKGTIGPCA